MYRSAVFVVCLAALCLSSTDPFIGKWKCVPANGADYARIRHSWNPDDVELLELGTLLQVKYDSSTYQYTGYVRAPSDSLALRGWVKGAARWRHITYIESLIYPGNSVAWFYRGFVRGGVWKQVTPDRRAEVPDSVECIFKVAVLPSKADRGYIGPRAWFSAVKGDTVLAISDTFGVLKEVWQKEPR